MSEIDSSLFLKSAGSIAIPSIEATDVFLAIKNSAPISVTTETKDELAFRYRSVDFVANIDEFGEKGNQTRSVFFCAEVCKPDSPKIVQAMVGMMRANYIMMRFGEMPIFFSLKDAADSPEGVFCLSIKIALDRTADFEWSKTIEELEQQIIGFRDVQHQPD
ncbi:MAG: hypothetical protein ACK5NY_07485 [Burkholderiaceae bacterium]|jgi:hypothetical protein